MQQKPTNNIQKRPPITKPKPINDKNMANAHLSLFPTPITLPIRATTHQTIADIEAKARAHAETFTMESSCELPTPPLEVKMKGLYILLSKIDIIMNKTIMEDLEETTSLLMKMEVNGTLNSALMSAFGQWYLFPLVSTFSLPKFLFS